MRAIPLEGPLAPGQLATLQHFADLVVPPLPPSSEDHFLKCMRMLRLLPTRGDDDLSGDLRLALYRRHFGGLSETQLSHLVEHATLTCKFFPTPSECQMILDGWKRTDPPHRAVQFAKARLQRALQDALDDVMLRFRSGQVTQEEASTLPEQWQRIAETRGFLRRVVTDEAVTYVLRPSGVVRDE